MAENTGIEWADSTFNPWVGCSPVSPACSNCYAEVSAFARASRSRGVELWGPQAARRRTSNKGWNEVRSWNKKAAGAADRPRVFCASLADVFEDRRDLDPWRADLFKLIEECRNLDFLLLTKRAALMLTLTPPRWQDGWPMNVWAGVTAEDQTRWDQRVATLARVPAHVHFVSAEPLVGPIVMGRLAERVDWLIVGGESGANARPMNAAWVRALRDEAAQQGSALAFHFKQWGEHNEAGERVGKRAAGRLLDGRAWDRLPIAADLARDSIDKILADPDDEGGPLF